MVSARKRKPASPRSRVQMSVIHFKFKNAKEAESVTFDGTGMPVTELKSLIAQKKKFSKESASELLLTDPQTGTGNKNPPLLCHDDVIVMSL